jgi:hypothetical protein
MKFHKREMKTVRKFYSLGMELGTKNVNCSTGKLGK